MKSPDGFPKNLNVKENTKQNIKFIASQDASQRRLNLYAVVLATGSLISPLSLYNSDLG